MMQHMESNLFATQNLVQETVRELGMCGAISPDGERVCLLFHDAGQHGWEQTTDAPDLAPLRALATVAVEANLGYYERNMAIDSDFYRAVVMLVDEVDELRRENAMHRAMLGVDSH